MRAGLVERLVETTQARDHKLFGGKLDKSNLNWCERVAVRCAHASEETIATARRSTSGRPRSRESLEQSLADAQGCRHPEAVRRGAGPRRLLALRRARPDARLPRPERGGERPR